MDGALPSPKAGTAQTETHPPVQQAASLSLSGQDAPLLTTGQQHPFEPMPNLRMLPG